MTIALDIDGSCVRSLRREGSRLVGRRLRLVYSLLPDSPRHRGLLDSGRIPYATAGGQLVLAGSHAVDYARLFRGPLCRVLEDGKLPHDHPLARQLMAALFDAVLPRTGEPDEVCCLTLPGGAGRDGERTAAFLTRLVRLAGYEPVVVPPGMAVVLAGLSPASFTGIGLRFGAAACELSIAHHGVEVVSLAIDRGGDWIDAQLAEQQGCFLWDAEGRRHVDLEAVGRLKAGLAEPLSDAVSSPGRSLAALYAEVLDELCRELARVAAGLPLLGTFPRPLDVVVAGGPARVPGFADLLHERLESVPLPVVFARPRLAAGEYTVARGCLIHAHVEDIAARQNSRAAA